MKPSSFKTRCAFAVLPALLGILFTTSSVLPAPSTPGKSNKSSLWQLNANKVIDLTQVLGPDLPSFHVGSKSFEYKTVHSVEKDGYALGEFTTLEHYGTHVDAPSHFYAGATTIDQIPAQKLIAPCVVIDVRAECKSNPDYALTLDRVKTFEKGGAIPAGAAVLLLTGWQDRFHDAKAYRNADSKGQTHWPGFGADSAAYLMKEKQATCLGIDTLSLDVGNTNSWPVHHSTLKQNVYLIENLTNLDKVPSRGALLFCGPLRIKSGTGSPARVLALVP